MRKIYIFLFTLILATNVTNGQTTIAFQGFDDDSTWSTLYRSVNPSTINNGTPSGQNIRTGSKSWQTNDANTTLILNNVNVSNYSGVSVTVHLSSTSHNSPSNGADASDNVKIYVILNGTTPSNPDVTVNGYNNSRWKYDDTEYLSAAGTSVTYGRTSSTPTVNYSTFKITIPAGTTTVGLLINGYNNDGNERWNIDDITLQGTTVLPLSLLDFNAKMVGNNAALAWKTTCERNVNRFEVERQGPDAKFITLGTVNANNSGCINTTEYNFSDATLSAGRVYQYRLKMIDNDGSFSYSKLVSLLADGSERPYLGENPVSSVITVKNTQAADQIQIISLDGKIIGQYKGVAGQTVLNAASLAKGTYIVNVLRNGNKTTMQVIK